MAGNLLKTSTCNIDFYKILATKFSSLVKSQIVHADVFQKALSMHADRFKILQTQTLVSENPAALHSL